MNNKEARPLWMFVHTLSTQYHMMMPESARWRHSLLTTTTTTTNVATWWHHEEPATPGGYLARGECLWVRGDTYTGTSARVLTHLCGRDRGWSGRVCPPDMQASAACTAGDPAPGAWWPGRQTGASTHHHHHHHDDSACGQNRHLWCSNWYTHTQRNTRADVEHDAASTHKLMKGWPKRNIWTIP